MSSMMPDLAFLSPVAWWALLTLAAPVLVHLIHRSRGRLVKTGHVELLRAARKIRVTEVRLNQWLLLLLRLVILGLALLILAGLALPGLRGSPAATVYVTPAWLKTAAQDEVDELLAMPEKAPGARIMLLQAGLPPLDRRTSEVTRGGPALGADDFNNAWAMLAEALSLEAHAGPVTVFATDHVLQFGVLRPALPRDVDWRLGHPRESPNLAQKDIRALIVHGPDRTAEARLFEGVMAGLKAHRLPALTWQVLGRDSFRPGLQQADWLILLDENGLGATDYGQFDPGTVVLMDANGEEQEGTEQSVRLPFYPFSEFGIEMQASASLPAVGGGETLLAGPGGKPLLQETRAGGVRLLQFNSRFDPRWSSIARQPGFPELLLRLMLGDGTGMARYADARTMPAMMADADAESGGSPLPFRPLRQPLAVLLVLLWVAERWLSERKRRARA